MPKLINMRTLLLLLLLGSFTLSCEKTSVDGVDLIGEWKWIANPEFDSNYIFEFVSSDTLVLHDVGINSSSYGYELFRDNTIQIEYGTRIDRDEIITYTNDSIEIIGFTISGIPEDRNTILKRIID